MACGGLLSESILVCGCGRFARRHSGYLVACAGLAHWQRDGFSGLRTVIESFGAGCRSHRAGPGDRVLRRTVCRTHIASRLALAFEIVGTAAPALLMTGAKREQDRARPWCDWSQARTGPSPSRPVQANSVVVLDEGGARLGQDRARPDSDSGQHKSPPRPSRSRVEPGAGRTEPVPITTRVNTSHHRDHPDREWSQEQAGPSPSRPRVEPGAGRTDPSGRRDGVSFSTWHRSIPFPYIELVRTHQASEQCS